MPDVIDTPSGYATEGSALHYVMDALITDPERDLMDYLGAEIEVKNEGVVEITHDLLHDCIGPALTFYDREISQRIGPNDPILVEQRVQFPGIEGAFGTCDLIAFDSKHGDTWITDWKFGQGVPVFASYAGDDGRMIPNAQLMFYACAARHTLPKLFNKNGRVVLTIVQPRSQDADARLTQARVTHAALDAFEVALRASIAAAQRPDAPKKIGDHCRWAPCRTICPLQLAPLVDLSELYPPQSLKAPTAEVLADILDLAAMIEPVINEARRQAHELMEAGGIVPGYKVVAKRATRSWAADDAVVLKAFRKLRITKGAMLEYKLKSPAQAEKLLPKGTLIPDGLVAAISSGTTIAKDSDPRPGVSPIGSVVTAIVDELGGNPLAIASNAVIFRPR
jgi:hypothetical protein